MIASRVTGPAQEPVSLAGVKAHLRLDHDDEDPILTAYIRSSRLATEEYLRRSLITQTWEVFADDWPSHHDYHHHDHFHHGNDRHKSYIALPFGPIQSVDQVQVFADDDTAQDVSLSVFQLDKRRNRLWLRDGQTVPMPTRKVDGLRALYTAGYGDNPGDVPEAIRVAIMQIAATLFCDRTLNVSKSLDGATSLLQPYRIMRI